MGSTGGSSSAGRPGATSQGERRRLLQHRAVQSAQAGPVRRKESRHWVAAIGNALVLTARELSWVLTLFLVMFMTGEVWRYVGGLAGPRLVVLIAGPILAAVALAWVGLWYLLRAPAVHIPGGAESVGVPRALRRRSMTRATVRVWGQTVAVGIAVAAVFGVVGVTTVDADLTREWAGRTAEVFPLWQVLGEELIVSDALLQVVGFLGAVAALMFVIEVLVDQDSRHALLDDVFADYDRAVEKWAAERETPDPRPTAPQTP